MAGHDRTRYLYVRILEACNAGCFMCGFAHSRDTYRFGPDDLAAVLPEARAAGVGFIRFTGGEPLMHKEILSLVRMGAEAGMGVSVITNGMLLPRMLPDLVAHGLQHVVVSIDSAFAETHDRLRDARDCFGRAVEGLHLAVAAGLVTRVNTVVGPHNYREMPALQRILTDIGVHQWELSALKLSDMPEYDDIAGVLEVGTEVYEGGLLRPSGKRWYGDTEEERRRYFEEGVPPRASGPRCHAATDVVYLDGRNAQAFACSCLPHRPKSQSGPVPVRIGLPTGRQIFDDDLRRQQDYFHRNGPFECTGCSSAAAGYSDLVEISGTPGRWSY